MVTPDDICGGRDEFDGLDGWSGFTTVGPGEVARVCAAYRTAVRARDWLVAALDAAGADPRLTASAVAAVGPDGSPVVRLRVPEGFADPGSVRHARPAA